MPEFIVTDGAGQANAEIVPCPSSTRKAPANLPQTTEKTGLKTVCEMTELSFLAC